LEGQREKNLEKKLKTIGLKKKRVNLEKEGKAPEKEKDWGNLQTWRNLRGRGGKRKA